MLTLDLTNAPRWHDLAPGVRAQLRPLTTALMVATRSDPAVEAVIVLTPPASHRDVGARCLAAGKHVLVEKPMAITGDTGVAYPAARCAAAGPG